MQTLMIVLQLIVGLGIYNVWLVRPNMATAYRGKGAPNLRAEFSAYGLPTWMFYVIGFLKLVAATVLIVGIWIPGLVQPAVALLGLLMIGAVVMHLKVSDSFKQTAPALAMLLMSIVIVLLG